MRNMTPRLVTLIVLFALLLLPACSSAAEVTYSGSAFTVDPLFESFYRQLGGFEVIGAVISPRFESNGFQYQYTENVLMMYDPQASSLTRYRLAPLAAMLGIFEPAEARSESGAGGYINGFNLWLEAMPLLEQLGGVGVAGGPVSRVRYNPHNNHYEQYYENLGFSRKSYSQTGKVTLLPLGAWACAQYCADVGAGDVLPDKFSPPDDELLKRVAEYIMVVAYRLGIENTGWPVTAVTINPNDGRFEIVFENMVIVADRDNPSRPYVRKLADSVGLSPEPIAPPIATYFFFPVEGDLGYSVRPAFMEYITLHGGVEVSGMPIGNEFDPSNTLTRQCFENLCLEYDKVAPAQLRVRPSPFGLIYKELFYRLPGDAPVAGEISIQTWQTYALLPPGQAQTIFAIVFEDGIPATGVALKLYWQVSETEIRSQDMGLTDEYGKASLEIGPLDAPNGNIIPYEVCVSGLSPEAFCQNAGFVIWGSP